MKELKENETPSEKTPSSEIPTNDDTMSSNMSGKFSTETSDTPPEYMSGSPVFNPNSPEYASEGPVFNPNSPEYASEGPVLEKIEELTPKTPENILELEEEKDKEKKVEEGEQAGGGQSGGEKKVISFNLKDGII
jgi:hypothetical protein